ncbi:hypothetical protein OG234_13055 [Streptomyces sp. NBC_01420]|uniref:hypothetical protein n=1 Tax=Streptomyces sp. NBC_01420 TaxID=2903858 RepID=UPI00324E1BC3
MTTKRSSGDIARRRRIADAADGYPARVTVVLYACVPPGTSEDDVVARLRRHAGARDWLVIGEVVDYTSTSTPLGFRPNWLGHARPLLTSGQAGGLVTTSRTDACFAELPEWLQEQHAFLSELMPAAAQGAA